MRTEGVKRKLIAILSADVKGYSRLMEHDEVATLRVDGTPTASRMSLRHKRLSKNGRTP